MVFKFNNMKISREEFFNIKEEDVMFITNPGRMGDENGSTFVIKKGNDYIPYRLDGWMYGDRTIAEFISFDEMLKHFPKWKEVLDNWNNEEYDGKYVYVYMGFGNGLSVDKSIYEEFEPYLLEEVRKVKEKTSEIEENSSMYYLAWKPAIEKMLNDKV